MGLDWLIVVLVTPPPHSTLRLRFVVLVSVLVRAAASSVLGVLAALGAL